MGEAMAIYVFPDILETKLCRARNCITRGRGKTFCYVKKAVPVVS